MLYSPSHTMKSFALCVLVLVLAQLCVSSQVIPRAVDQVEQIDQVDEVQQVDEVEQVESWPDGLQVTVLFTRPPGEAPIILHDIPIVSGSVSTVAFSSSSGPKIPGGAIAGLIVGIVVLWTLCLLLCLLLILLIAMSSGSTRFSEGTGMF
jgi:hypothetical protein